MSKRHEPNQALEALDEVVVMGLGCLGALVLFGFFWAVANFWVGLLVGAVVFLITVGMSEQRRDERIRRDRRRR